MKSGMNYMISKGEWVVLFFHEKIKENHGVRSCSDAAAFSLSDCIFL